MRVWTPGASPDREHKRGLSEHVSPELSLMDGKEAAMERPGESTHGKGTIEVQGPQMGKIHMHPRKQKEASMAGV